MKAVNRAAIVVQPRAALVQWINGLAATRDAVSIDDICDDCGCYLIPEVLSRREQKEYLEQQYLPLFRQELRCWEPDESKWPQAMTFTTFLEWFSVRFHSSVQDVADYDLWRESEVGS